MVKNGNTTVLGVNGPLGEKVSECVLRSATRQIAE